MWTGSAVLSVGRMSDFFHYIIVRVEIPYGGYNKLICKSKRLIMIWRQESLLLVLVVCTMDEAPISIEMYMRLAFVR